MCTRSFPFLYILFSCSISAHANEICVFEDVNIETALNSCTSGSIGVITDGNRLEWTLLQWTQRRANPVSYFDMRKGDHHLDVWLRTAYVNDSTTDFVVVVNNPGNVVDKVDEIFRNHSSPTLSALPHRSRWVIFVWTQRKLQQIKSQQMGSLLDNIAVVHLTIKKPPRGLVIKHIWTYVWATNRTKFPQSVRLSLLGDSCALFPNTKYGMNGRELNIIGKSNILRYLHFQRDPLTGNVEYAGDLIKLLHGLSRLMNFTYTIWPPPLQMDNLEWNDYVRLLSSGKFDIGLTHFESTVTGDQSDTEAGYPYRYDTVTGIYRKPYVPSLLQNRNTISVIYTYALLTVSLLTTGTVYFIYVYGVNPCIESRRGRVGLCCIKRNTSHGFRVGNLNRKCIRGYFNSLAYFLITSFNQGRLPNVKPMSARILVWSWGVLVVCLYSVFTSVITANSVRKFEWLPFQTFSEMIDQQDYTWSLDSFLIKYALEMSKAGLKKYINDHAKRVEREIGPIPTSYLKSLPYNVVFISFKKDLEDWLRTQPHPEDYFIMKDVLFQTRHSLGFPVGSEIKSTVSLQITRLHESGFLRIFNNPSSSQVNKSDDSQTLPEDIMDSAIHIAAAELAVALLSLAILILIIEIVTSKIQQRKEKSR